MDRTVVISGYIGFSNFGDDAIFSVLTRSLKERGIKILALSSNPVLTSRNFDVEAFRYNNPFAILKAFLGANTLISGGGSLLQNTTSNRSLIYYLLIILFAKFLGKKVVIFAQGIGPIKGKLWQALVRMILSFCDVVTVRNSFSQRLLNKWKIESKLVCDPVFELKTPTPKISHNIIGVQLRPYLKMHKKFVENLADAILARFSDKKIHIFTFQNSMDEKICSEFLNYLNAKMPKIDAEIVSYKSIEQVENDFASLEYLFAMRFHAALLGLKSGIKTLPLSYDEKVTNLAQDFGVTYIEASEQIDFDRVITEFLNAPTPPPAQDKKIDWEYFEFLVK